MLTALTGDVRGRRMSWRDRVNASVRRPARHRDVGHLSLAVDSRVVHTVVTALTQMRERRPAPCTPLLHGEAQDQHGDAQRDRLSTQRLLVTGAADRLARQTGRWPIRPDVLRNGALLGHVALRYRPPVHDHGLSTAGRWLVLTSHRGVPAHR